MKYTLLPTFKINELENALKIQYGEDFVAEIESEYNGLRNLLFDDRYMNDVCIKYNLYDFDEEYDEENRLEKCVRDFLISIIPSDYSSVIIDVSW